MNPKFALNYIFKPGVKLTYPPYVEMETISKYAVLIEGDNFNFSPSTYLFLLADFYLQTVTYQLMLHVVIYIIYLLQVLSQAGQ